MLHLEYRDEEYNDCRIDIQPEDENDIQKLQPLLLEFEMENPVTTLINKYKNGDYEGFTYEEVAAQAEVAHILSQLWGGKDHQNIVMLLCRALQTVVNLSG